MSTATSTPTRPAPISGLDADGRYLSPGRRGAHRPLTAAEHQQWLDAVARWQPAPPWTQQAEADNLALRTLLVRLYEDGVALATLARTAGWGQPRLSGILHRARAEGLTSGTRRYIAPPTPEKPAPARRALTSDERDTLVSGYAALPATASGGKNWNSPQGTDLRALLASLNADDVALDTLGAAIRVTRQAVHHHLSRHRKA